jgi:hypothetical protein
MKVIRVSQVPAIGDGGHDCQQRDTRRPTRRHIKSGKISPNSIDASELIKTSEREIP